MAEVIKMPRLSDTMEEGNIVGWLKQVGDKVAVGDVLAEVETDKATMELESFYEGVLLYIGIKEGPIAVDGILAVIGDEGEDFQAALDAQQENAGSSADVAASSSEETVKAPVASPATNVAPAASEAPVSTTSENRVKASPLAKSIAKNAGVDIAKIQGTGDQGRVIKRDVEAYIANPPVEATSSVPSGLDFGVADFQYGEVPTSQMRKVIARRLGESKFTAPHFYLTMEIDMENVMDARKQINAASETRISFNDIIVKATAMALRKHPAINASWLGDAIRYNKEINIGVAVAIPDGLLVPVIRNTDFKTLEYINKEVRALAGKAKEKKLQPDEMTGNTFTISNLGMYPIDEFTAIINPPDACIMAVGTIVEKPVVKQGQIVVGHTMKVTLSCDHRVVDGATGAAFLMTFRDMLEQPLKMML